MILFLVMPGGWRRTALALFTIGWAVALACPAAAQEYRVSIERSGDAEPRFSTPGRRSSYWFGVSVSRADELECLTLKASNTGVPKPRPFVGRVELNVPPCSLPPRPGAERGGRDPERVSLPVRARDSFYWIAPECSEVDRARLQFNVMAEWRGSAGAPVRWANAEIDFSTLPSCTTPRSSGGGGGSGSAGGGGGGSAGGGSAGGGGGGRTDGRLTASTDPVTAGASVTVTAMLGDEHRAWGRVSGANRRSAWWGQSFIATPGMQNELAGRGARLDLSELCPTHRPGRAHELRIDPLLKTCTFTVPGHSCRSGTLGRKCWPLLVVLFTSVPSSGGPIFYNHRLCIRVRHPSDSGIVSHADC